jgi:CelD/BcsL family acetyltransferase involved in cellulose biosynthesis
VSGPHNRDFLLEPVADPAAISADWSRLAELSGNVFATWEWTQTWLEHFQDGRALAVHVCRREDGEIAAILPLYLARSRPPRVLRFVGHGPADQLGPICAKDDAAAAARALLRLAGERPHGAHALLLDRLAGDEGWSELLGSPVIHREPSPVLRVAGRSWEEFLASRSRNFREQIGRRGRKLAREHDVDFRLAGGERALDEDFATLVRLHRLRFGAEEGAFEGDREAFHRRFAERALARGWLRLWLLDVDGATVAAWYGLRYAGIESYYNAGRDPAWDAQSVGFVLLAHTIRAAFEDGAREYRFLLGGESYKDRFADHDGGLETVLVGRGPLGRAGAAAMQRLPVGARRKVRRLAGASR